MSECFQFIDHPPNHYFYGCYKPSPNNLIVDGIGLTTLLKSLLQTNSRCEKLSIDRFPGFHHGSSTCFCMWRFPKLRYPKTFWSIMEIPNLKWMITRGTPSSGNLHVSPQKFPPKNPGGKPSQLPSLASQWPTAHDNETWQRPAQILGQRRRYRDGGVEGEVITWAVEASAVVAWKETVAMPKKTWAI